VGTLGTSKVQFASSVYNEAAFRWRLGSMNNEVRCMFFGNELLKILFRNNDGI
jgi:hypothetical protein